MKPCFWVEILIWLGIIGGCVWIAVKARGRTVRIITTTAAVVLSVCLAVAIYGVLLACPLPNPSAHQEAAAVKALDELAEAWCADSWDEVWAQTAGLGKMEEKRDMYIRIWRSHKAEDFPGGVQPHELQAVGVCRPPISVFKIFLALSLPPDAPETPADINRLTTRLLREGMVCLVYRLKDEPYVNIIVNEAGVWRPMTTPNGFPIGDWDYDFLDEPLARAGDKLQPPSAQ